MLINLESKSTGLLDQYCKTVMQTLHSSQFLLIYHWLDKPSLGTLVDPKWKFVFNMSLDRSHSKYPGVFPSKNLKILFNNYHLLSLLNLFLQDFLSFFYEMKETEKPSTRAFASKHGPANVTKQQTRKRMIRNKP